MTSLLRNRPPHSSGVEFASPHSDRYVLVGSDVSTRMTSGMNWANTLSAYAWAAVLEASVSVTPASVFSTNSPSPTAWHWMPAGLTPAAGDSLTAPLMKHAPR